jgi:hypothetical protein
VQQLGGGVPGEEHASAVQARDRHEVELQLGDDPEVALAAAQRPEQLGVADRVDPPDRAVAVTISALRTWSAANRSGGPSGPSPPPRV